jgi:hypothetical protein
MMKAMRPLVLGLLLSVVASATSCSSKRYCEKLTATARDPAVQATARALARSFSPDEVSVRDVDAYDGVGPGLRWLGHAIDNELFGFGNGGHIRLVGPTPVDERDDTVGESVDSLMFTERSRTGILVRLPTKASFGDISGKLVKVDEDIAVLCER